MDEYSGTKKAKKVPWVLGAVLLVIIGAIFALVTLKGTPATVSPLPESTSGDVRVIFVSPEPTATESADLVSPSPTSQASPKATPKASPKTTPKSSPSASPTATTSPSSD